jgi:hypothetical protein
VLGRELRDAAADEELWHLLLVEVRADRQRVLRADAVEDREHPVLFHQLARELDRLRDVELVVEVLVGDLPPEHAAVRVDVLEVRIGAAAD